MQHSHVILKRDAIPLHVVAKPPFGRDLPVMFNCPAVAVHRLLGSKRSALSTRTPPARTTQLRKESRKSFDWFFNPTNFADFHVMTHPPPRLGRTSKPCDWSPIWRGPSVTRFWRYQSLKALVQESLSLV